MLYIWPNCSTTKGRCCRIAAADADIIGRGKGAIDLQCKQAAAVAAVAHIPYAGAPLYHVDGWRGTAGAKEKEEEEWPGRRERGRKAELTAEF